MLKNVLYLFFMITFLHSETNIDENFHFGFSISKLDKVHQNKIKSVSYRIEKEFEKILGEEYNVSLSFVKDEKELVQDYVNYKNHNILIVHSYIYLNAKKQFDTFSKDFYAFTNNNKFEEYILIVNKNSKIRSLKDIKNKRYGVYTESENSSNWLDYLTLKELKKPYKKLIGTEKRFAKDKTLLLNVFFKKIDFGIIRKSVFNDMTLLNPTIKDRVMILRESKPIFPYALGFIHKKTPKKLIDIFNFYIENGTFNKKFKNLFLLLNQTGFNKVSSKQLEELMSFHREYEKLRGKL